MKHASQQDESSYKEDEEDENDEEDEEDEGIQKMSRTRG